MSQEIIEITFNGPLYITWIQIWAHALALLCCKGFATIQLRISRALCPLVVEGIPEGGMGLEYCSFPSQNNGSLEPLQTNAI